MKKPRRKVYRGRRQRMYWGRDKDTKQRLYFKVFVSPAKQPVKIRGDILSAMMGEPGVSIGCELSNCGWKHNQCSGEQSTHKSQSN